MNILVVEDNYDLIETLSCVLERGGHTAITCMSIKEALIKLEEQIFDLILLDVMLPDDSGFELCRIVREKKQTHKIPVIFLSAKSQESDKIAGFEAGADDYVTKPFNIRELLLRIQAVLRRQPKSEKFFIAGISVDMSVPSVCIENIPIVLTALELRLFYVLYEHRGRVQTRTELLNSVWNIDAEITTRTVDTHIKRLREKLGGKAYLIETVRGLGYRLSEE